MISILSRINAVLATVIAVLAGIASCSKAPHAVVLFETLEAEETGLLFANNLKPSPDFNLFSYMYYYNGAGVGAGDFNNDGLTDLFFAANQFSPALYLNKGGLKFEDITAASGIKANGGWLTGVSVADINGDNLLDIYVCRVSGYKGLNGHNELWVCTGLENGTPRYVEQSKEYGLDFSGFSTQAAFFDYDIDGDLDMFLLNHAVNHDGNYAPRDRFLGTYDSLSGHRLYRNESNEKSFHFEDITQSSGINSSKIGYGLGIVVSDINFDGYPDLYIGNDFHENDYLYINNRKGGFIDSAESQLQHTSQFTMGVDAADINNDGLTDIAGMDMLPYDQYMLRRSLAEDAYDIFQQKIAYGYSYQYARNNLQLNRGNGSFAEIGQYAGIEATDWSWATLLMDFDNDGWRDLFVSNGIPKRMNDIDYINFVAGDELQTKLRDNTLEGKDLALINKFPEIKIPNQFFLNKKNWQFERLDRHIKGNPAGFSNGAVYADFDNDGDLDIVTNNINDHPVFYKNTCVENLNKESYLIRLTGSKQNTNAVGARIVCWYGDSMQLYESYPVRGFMSSMQLPIQIAKGNKLPDSTLLIWPDNTAQKINLQQQNNQTIRYTTGLPGADFEKLRKSQSKAAGDVMVTDVTAVSGIAFRHKENPFNEFTREALLPYKLSTDGPALAVADINADGLEDIFLGGSKTNKGKTWLQQIDGTFIEKAQPALAADSMWEHVDAQWADMNADGFPDLVIASGGNEYYGNDEHLKPLLYLNDGSGLLHRKTDAMPGVYVTQSKVLVQDFNADGFPDLFVAGRCLPWQYGSPPSSYLLINNGKGKFKDASPGWMKNAGMITDAALADMNADGKQDLLMCFDWGGVQVAYNGSKGLEAPATIVAATGWWQSLFVTDLNNDGLPDLLLGNYGLNNRLRASNENPVRLYVNDFDKNGRIEQVMTYYNDEKEIPFSGKMQLEKQLPGLKKKYLYAEQFAKASLAEIFGKELLKASHVYEATGFAHVAAINKGNNEFAIQSLPPATQLSTIRSFTPIGKNGVLALGNFYGYHVELGRQDGGEPLLLQYDGNDVKAMPIGGDKIMGEVRRVRSIRIGTANALVIAKNNAGLQLITIQP